MQETIAYDLDHDALSSPRTIRDVGLSIHPQDGSITVYDSNRVEEGIVSSLKEADCANPSSCC